MRGHRYVTEINVVAQTVRSGNPAATEPDCLFCRWDAGAACQHLPIRRHEADVPARRGRRAGRRVRAAGERRLAPAATDCAGVSGPAGSLGRPDRCAGLGYPAEGFQGRDCDADVERGPSGPRCFLLQGRFKENKKGSGDFLLNPCHQWWAILGSNQ